MSRSAIKDMTGQKVGKLTILEEAGRGRDNRIAWRCLCDCGTEKNITGHDLRRGHVKSCGCYRREMHRLPSGEARRNRIYKLYEKRAKDANRKFSLNMQEEEKLFKSNCYYCGVEPKQSWDSGPLHGKYLYNGIDRVDNSKGYVIDNCVPCCRPCNVAKGASSPEDFREWVQRLHNHLFNEKIQSPCCV